MSYPYPKYAIEAVLKDAFSIYLRSGFNKFRKEDLLNVVVSSSKLNATLSDKITSLKAFGLLQENSSAQLWLTYKFQKFITVQSLTNRCQVLMSCIRKSALEQSIDLTLLNLKSKEVFEKELLNIYGDNKNKARKLSNVMFRSVQYVRKFGALKDILAFDTPTEKYRNSAVSLSIKAFEERDTQF